VATSEHRVDRPADGPERRDDRLLGRIYFVGGHALRLVRTYGLGERPHMIDRPDREQTGVRCDRASPSELALARPLESPVMPESLAT